MKKNIYQRIVEIGVPICQDILNRAPSNPDATHFYADTYYEHWVYGAWVKFVGDQLEDTAAPPANEVIDLNQLGQALPHCLIIENLGGLVKAKEDVKMAKIMRTMYIGELYLNDVEQAIEQYEKHIPPSVTPAT